MLPGGDGTCESLFVARGVYKNHFVTKECRHRYERDRFKNVSSGYLKTDENNSERFRGAEIAKDGTSKEKIQVVPTS